MNAEARAIMSPRSGDTMQIHNWRVIVLMSLLSAGTAWAAPPGAPSRGELSLAGLKLGDSLALVRKKLGKPQSTTGAPGDHDYHLIYRGLRIEMTQPGQVLLLESTSPDYCTPSGLCPGQPLEQARKRWGEGEIYDGDDEGILHYGVDDDACFLQIQPDPSRTSIHSVAFACP
ncbi:hypothetical protein [Lysobacter sp. CA196]|uniref:hypothetical protein n=1 Tax=Lysobacter sp. CA196 TaxID=3455606 RepID=UPI003F8D42C3